LLVTQIISVQFRRQQFKFMQAPFSGAPGMRGVVAGQMDMGQVDIPHLGLIEPLHRSGRMGFRGNS